MQKSLKLRKGRLQGFVLKKFRLCWLPGTYFGIFLKKNEGYQNKSPDRTNVGIKVQV